MQKKTFLKKEKKNFYILVNNLFLEVEDNLKLYENDIDLDYTIQDYVMTISFSKKNLIIINKQESLKQIWLATRLNGYHFNYENNQWICNRSNKNFWEIFEHAFSVQSNRHITFIKK
ncbi:iron donor protein CyaY [Buchnera aphidicola (Macrosiphoniella sanborni)]|uniref:Iron-sulfur cluster assembly protein CyaY n=1 Tax=Buchnera aphidicola (Macrosiphoniella sanborni) TaxID=1241865 RepID=A0A4D6Y3L0_9GAMM|nr:iron donor protein CyaY [Buchnera aphidicola]QCI24082.1 iron donor protein CyaY [Buchnera aphidicola (Macrosiphoniella sanborni)]